MSHIKQYITIEDYINHYKKQHITYEGFVIGFGYVYPKWVNKEPSHVRGYGMNNRRLNLYGDSTHTITDFYFKEDRSNDVVKKSYVGLVNNGYIEVTKGMTLTRISNMFDVSIKNLCKWNNIKDMNKIYIGQKLKVNLFENSTLGNSSNQGNLHDMYDKNNFIKNYNKFDSNVEHIDNSNVTNVEQINMEEFYEYKPTYAIHNLEPSTRSNGLMRNDSYFERSYDEFSAGNDGMNYYEEKLIQERKSKLIPKSIERAIERAIEILVKKDSSSIMRLAKIRNTELALTNIRGDLELGVDANNYRTMLTEYVSEIRSRAGHDLTFEDRYFIDKSTSTFSGDKGASINVELTFKSLLD